MLIYKNMNLYLVAWVALSLLTLTEIVTNKEPSGKKLDFWSCYLILSAMLIFRYGQGNDYFGYRYNYYKVSDVAITFPKYDVHGELGYQLLCNVFRVCHIPFEGLVTLLAVIQMGCMLSFYKRYQVDCPFALLLSFPTLYLTYFMSGMRQGLAIAVFLGVLLPLLENRRYFAYIVGTLLCMTFHTVSVVFLILLIPMKIRKVSTLQILTVLAWLAGCILSTQEGQSLIMTLGISKLNYYLGNGASISLAAIAERLLFTGIITWLYLKLCKIGKCSDRFRFAYSCYLMAMALYGGLLWNELVASRTTSMLRFIEVYLLIYGIRQMRRGSRYLLVVILVAFETFMTVKNIQAAIDQGPYVQEVTVATYPYVSVFNSQDIYKYRLVPNKYINLPDWYFSERMNAADEHA